MILLLRVIIATVILCVVDSLSVAEEPFRLYLRPIRKSLRPGAFLEVEGTVLRVSGDDAGGDDYEVVVDERSLPSFLSVVEIRYTSDRSLALALETCFTIVLRADESAEAYEVERAVREGRQTPFSMGVRVRSSVGARFRDDEGEREYESREASVYLPYGVEIDEIGIVSINDWHGRMMPSDRDTRLRGGGSMTIRLDWLRSAIPDMILVTGGDCIGATQAESGLNDDEPIYGILEEWAVDVRGVGNHEFQNGMVSSLMDDSKIVCSNIVNSTSGSSIFPRYKVIPIVRGDNEYKVCFTGAVTEDFMHSVRSENRIDITVIPAKDAINRVILELKREHTCHTIIVIVHQGGWGESPNDFIRSNPTHEFTNIVKFLDPGVSIVVSAHTHSSYSWNTVYGHTVVQTEGHGISLGSCTLQFDHSTMLLLASDCEVIPAYTPYLHDPAEDQWYMNNIAVAALSIPTRARKVGSIVSAALAKRESKLPKQYIGELRQSWHKPIGDEETWLGVHIADAMYYAATKWLAAAAATDDAKINRAAGAVVELFFSNNVPVAALMNDGGIRDDWLGSSTSSSSGGGRGHSASSSEKFLLSNIEVWNSIPFFDKLFIVPATSRDLLDILEEQFSHPRYVGRYTQFQVAGFTYRYNVDRPRSKRSQQQRSQKGIVERSSLIYNVDAASAGRATAAGAVGSREDDRVLLVFPDYLVGGGDSYISIDKLVSREGAVAMHKSLFDAVIDYTKELALANRGHILEPICERAINVKDLLTDGQVVIHSNPQQVVVGPPGRVTTVQYTIEITENVTVNGPFTFTVNHISTSNNILEINEYPLEVTSLMGPGAIHFPHKFTVNHHSSHLQAIFRSELFDGNPFFPDGLTKNLDIAPNSSGTTTLFLANQSCVRLLLLLLLLIAAL